MHRKWRVEGAQEVEGGGCSGSGGRRVHRKWRVEGAREVEGGGCSGSGGRGVHRKWRVEGAQEVEGVGCTGSGGRGVHRKWRGESAQEVGGGCAGSQTSIPVCRMCTALSTSSCVADPKRTTSRSVSGCLTPAPVFTAVFSTSSQPVLETIRYLMNTECVVPDWLHDIFLGYGDPAAAQYTK